MARMPAEHRLGFGQRRHMLGGDHALHGDGAQIDEFQIVARFQRLDAPRIDADAETRRFVQKPEKHGLARGAERARLGGRKQRIERLACVASSTMLFAADDVDAGCARPPQRRQLGLIAAQGARRDQGDCRNKPGAARD